MDDNVFSQPSFHQPPPFHSLDSNCRGNLSLGLPCCMLRRCRCLAYQIRTSEFWCDNNDVTMKHRTIISFQNHTLHPESVVGESKVKLATWHRANFVVQALVTLCFKTC